MTEYFLTSRAIGKKDSALHAVSLFHVKIELMINFQVSKLIIEPHSKDKIRALI